MIKRRFYRAEHGDKDGASDDSSSSSSSSDSEIEAQDSDTESQPQHNHHIQPAGQSDLHDDDDDVNGPSHVKPHSPSSSSSGYESEDSSANEIEAESAGAGLLANDDSETERDGKQIGDGLLSVKENDRIVEPSTDHLDGDAVPSCILKCKSVFKCRLCPRIVCLNEESLKTHLKSKRHTRSENLLKNGRLKRVLNSDGEEVVYSDDDDGETHAERHARIVALAQNTVEKKRKGRQRQRQRLKRKKDKNLPNTQNNQQKDNRAKRRRKNVD